MKSAKSLTIKEIVHLSVIYPALLCRFVGGEYEVCHISYDCDKEGKNVVMKAYPVGPFSKNSGRVVEAYEPITESMDRWHGPLTDDTEPKKNERCYIFVERKRPGYIRYTVESAVYDGKIGFYGFKESAELSILGFLHIRENGNVY